MHYAEDQLSELKLLCRDVREIQEGGCSFLFLPALHLPDGCTPQSRDAILCPFPRDGYASRLFFAEKIQSNNQCNWNASGVRIAERNWHAFSWQTNANLRLAQMIAAHLRAFL